MTAEFYQTSAKSRFLQSAWRIDFEAILINGEHAWQSIHWCNVVYACERADQSADDRCSLLGTTIKLERTPVRSYDQFRFEHVNLPNHVHLTAWKRSSGSIIGRCIVFNAHSSFGSMHPINVASASAGIGGEDRGPTPLREMTTAGVMRLS